MKKALVIALIALATLSSVFAADPTSLSPAGSAAIRVDYTVGTLLPTFKLAASGDDIRHTSSTASNVVLGADLTYYKTLSATVDFSIIQISESRIVGSYDITVTATDLLLTSTAEELEMSAADFAAIEEANKKFVVDSVTPIITKHEDYDDEEIGHATLSQNDNTLSVTYQSALRATSEAPVELGTFSCTWAQNKKAVTGIYEATIKMTVSAR